MMNQYKVVQKAEEALAKLDKIGFGTEREELLRKRAVAIAEAVNGLGKLHHQEIFAKLEKLICKDNLGDPSLKINLSNDFLNNDNPLFWC